MKYCNRRYCILLGLILSIFVCACSVPEKKNVDDGIVEDKIQTNTSKEDTEIKVVETEKTETSVSEEVSNYVELIILDKTGYYGFYAKDEAGELFDIGSVCMNVKNSLNSFLTLE